MLPKLVLVLSRNAIESPHVMSEVERASSKRRPVLSVRMDATELPPDLEYFVSANHWLDASDGPIEGILPALSRPCGAGMPVKPVVRYPPAVGRAPGNRSGAAFCAKHIVVALAQASACGRLAVMALGLIAVLADKSWLSKRVDEEKSLVAAPPAIPDKSVAVLPFIDMSQKKDQEYFSDGLAEELLNVLARVQS